MSSSSLTIQQTMHLQDRLNAALNLIARYKSDAIAGKRTIDELRAENERLRAASTKCHCTSDENVSESPAVDTPRRTSALRRSRPVGSGSDISEHRPSGKRSKHTAMWMSCQETPARDSVSPSEEETPFATHFYTHVLGTATRHGCVEYNRAHFLDVRIDCATTTQYTLEQRVYAVSLALSSYRSVQATGEILNISERSLRRWCERGSEEHDAFLQAKTQQMRLRLTTTTTKKTNVMGVRL